MDKIIMNEKNNYDFFSFPCGEWVTVIVSKIVYKKMGNISFLE